MLKINKQKIGYVVGEILMVLSMVLLTALYLVVATGSSLKLKNFITPFVYVSFILSFLFLISSLVKKLKSSIQNNKPFSLILCLFLSFAYAAARVRFFPNLAQFEDLGTAIIILISFVVMVFQKEQIK